MIRKARLWYLRQPAGAIYKDIIEKILLKNPLFSFSFFFWFSFFWGGEAYYMCYKNIKEVLQTGVLQGEVRGYGRDAKARKKEDSKLLPFLEGGA